MTKLRRTAISHRQNLELIYQMILAHAHSVKHAYLFQGPLMIVLFCKPIILSRFIRPIHVPKPRIPSTENMNEKGKKIPQIRPVCQSAATQISNYESN